jgi:hypothetical protein
VSPKLQRLRAEVASDLATFKTRVGELSRLPSLAQAARGTLAEAAVALHHAYGAAESAFSRIARVVDDGVPEGADWHQALLNVMALRIEQVRPAIISPESRDLLQRLLGFRHFFRHAYAVDLDGDRLELLRREAVSLVPLLEADFARFDEFLSDAGKA